MTVPDQMQVSGQQIGSYQVEDLLIGRRMSNLYLARDVKLDREVFLEVMQVTAEQDPDLVGRFSRRVEALAHLKHDHIANLIEHGTTDEGYPYAVSEYVSGLWLSEQIEKWNQSNVSLSPEEALNLSRQIADALSVAHASGLIHHDLRPDNLLIQPDKTIVLTDLMIPVTLTPRDAVLSNGQPSMLDYASPEEAEGRAISRRSNIYSLGIILYELLTGHRPMLPDSSWDIFERATMPKEVPLEVAREGLSGETYRLVRNCLWRQEWSRFETADEVITAIDTAILAEQALPRAAIWPGTNRNWRTIGAIVGAIVIIALIFGLVSGQFTGAGQGSAGQNQASAPTLTAQAAAILQEAMSVTPTPTPTREAAPTTAANVRISILGPLENQDFQEEDRISFLWFWLSPLNAGQDFVVYVIPEDSDSAEPIRLSGEITSDNGGVYRLNQSIRALELDAGSYLWLVRLENATTDALIAESDASRFIIVANTPTPTVTASVFATPAGEALSTATPTATSTREVCIRRRPPGWVEHVVQPGENPSTFADPANIPVEFLLEVNCLDNPRSLSIGTVIYIPAPPATNTPIPVRASPTAPSSGGGSSGGGGSRPTPAPTTPPNATATPDF